MMSSEEESSQISISTLLTNIGLGQYARAFEKNMIGIENVELMTEEDFVKVGIYVIGVRLKIKQACQNYLKGTESSLVVQKFIDLQEPKKKNKTASARRNLVKNEKTTRRVYLGWKHSISKDIYKVVSARDGGGQQVIDVPKDCGFQAFVQRILDIYFPNGRSEAKNLNLIEVTYFIASFSGMKVPQLEEMGGFTIGKYFTFVKSYPVRVYLHTLVKDINDVMPVPGCLEPPIALTTTDQSNNADMTDSDDDFEMLGTPTILVNRRCRHFSMSLTELRARASARANSQFVAASTSGHNDSSPIPQEMVEVFDSEDEQLERENQAGFMESQARYANTDDTLEDLLKGYMLRAVEPENGTDLIISRRHVLESAFRGMQRHSFRLNANLYIKFSGEIGQDYGGPRREFFRLALKELSDSLYFDGKDGEKIFTHNIELLEAGRYHLAGCLVALSIAQKGPGPHFLNGSLYDMTGKMHGTCMPQFDINVLPQDAKDVMEKLKDVDSFNSRDEFLLKHGDWLVEQGIPNVWRLSLDSKVEMMELIIKQILYYRCASEVSAFTTGLNDVGQLWELIKANPLLFKPLFCFMNEPLTKDKFESLCKVQYSEEGSNRRVAEDESVYAWELFLQDITDKTVPATFGELLSFITGADVVPPLGFNKIIEIKFFDQEEGQTRLPSVSTCALEFYIPRGINNPATFSALMVRALKESIGFEKI